MRIWPWFVLAGAVFVAALAAAGFQLLSQLEAFDTGLKRVAIPGTATVELDKAGSYTIFFEQQGETAHPPSGLSVGLASEASGAALPLVRPSGKTRYSIHDRSGIAILVFTAEPGRYRVSANLPPGGASDASLAIGLAGIGSIFKTIGFTFAVVGTGLGLAAAIVAFALWRRSKARKAATA
jgi:hypothetical protein